MMALPCGHRRNPDQTPATGAGRVHAGRCPICPIPGGTTTVLLDQHETCRACFLSAGACSCCGYHWIVHEDQARQVLAAVDHEART